MDLTNTALLVLSVVLQTNVHERPSPDTNFSERVTAIGGSAYLGFPLPDGRLGKVPQPIPFLLSVQTNFVPVTNAPYATNRAQIERAAEETNKALSKRRPRNRE